jgi:hypothetical protein
LEYAGPGKSTRATKVSPTAQQKAVGLKKGMVININLAGSTASVDISVPELEAQIAALAATVKLLVQLEQANSAKFDQILAKENQIMDTQAQLVAALTKIDDNTTAAAGSMQAYVTLGTSISAELDAFINAAKTQAVPQGLVDQATAIAAKTDLLAKGLGDFVPFLQQVAVKGAADPVPVSPPAPPSTPA